MDPPACEAIQTTAADPSIYRPLNPVSRQIRLLKFHPGTEGVDVQCQLEYVLLEDNPEYTALSYVWGDLTGTRTILLQNVPFPVTKSLHAALRSIRSRTPETSKFWVDALCINQQDLAERSRQVTLMPFIYGQAKHTIVWFGPGSELSKRAIQLMIEMKNTLKPQDNPWFIEKSKDILYARCGATAHPMTHLLNRLEAWEALTYLLNVPWWTRVWVAQEIKLSKDPILLWGEDDLFWIHCEEAMGMTNLWLGLVAYDREFKDSHSQSELRKGMQNALAVVELCQSHRPEEPKRGLLHLMDSFAPNEATDPRDKVYALLGLATDNHSESMIPNYESPVSVVYAESVKDIISREGNLQVLSYCSGLFTTRDTALPSWAPDWKSRAYDSKRPPEQRHLTLYQIDGVIRRPYVSAKPEEYVSRAAGDSPPAVGFCKQMRTLYTVGIRVDVIFKTSNTRSAAWVPDEALDGWSTLSGYHDHTNFYPPTGQLRADACIETLAVGQFTPHSQTREVMRGITLATSGRRFFVGEAGYQGLALSLAQTNDVVVVLLGGPYPLVLRETEGHYTMVGGKLTVRGPPRRLISSQTHTDTAEVHGIMNGEIMTRLEDGQVELEEFEIW